MSEHGNEHGGTAVAESHAHDAGHGHAAAPDLRFEKDELHEFEAEDRDAGRHIGLLLAAVFCIGLGLALGVTVYGNGGMNTDYPGDQLPSPGGCGPATGPGSGFNPAPGPYNLFCGNGRLGVDLVQLVIAPTLAWKIHPDHSIGISPLFAYQRFKQEGLQTFDTPFLSNSPGNVTNRGHDGEYIRELVRLPQRALPAHARPE